MIKFKSILQICVVLLFVENSSLRCQQNSSPTADQVYEKATAFSTQNSLDSTVYYYKKAAQQYLSEGNTEKYVNSYAQFMVWNYSLSNYDLVNEVATHLLEVTDTASIAMISHRANAYKHQGMIIELKDGDYPKALSYYHRGLHTLKNGPDGDEIKITLNKDAGIAHLMMGKLDSTDFYFQKALGLQLKHFEPEKNAVQAVKLADTYRLIGTRHVLYSEYTRAQFFLKKALNQLLKAEKVRNVDLDKSNVYSNLGSLFLNEGYADSALYYFGLQKSILSKLPESQTSAGLYGDLSNIYLQKRNYDSSMVYAKKSLEVQESLLSPNHPELAYIYILLGDISIISQGSLEDAQNYYQEALNIREASLGENHFLTAEAIRRQAVVLKNRGRLTESLALQEIAMARMAKAEGQNVQSLMIAMNELGTLELATGLFQKSIDSFKKVIDLARKVETTNPEIIVTAHTEAAKAYLALSKLDKARSELKQAEAIFEHGLNSRHPNFADIWDVRAQLSFQENDLSASLLQIERCLEVLFPQSGLTEDGRFRSIQDVKHYLLAASFRSQVLFTKYRSTKELNWLKLAIVQDEQMISFVKWLLPLQSNHQDLLFLSKSWQSIYQHLFERLSELISIENTPLHKERLFTIYEESKALSLLFKKNERLQYSSAILPADLRKKESQLKTDMAYFSNLVNQSQVAGSIESAVLDYAQKRLLTLSLDFKNHVNSLSRDYKEYYKRYYEVKATSISTIRNELRKNQVIVEYILTEEKFVFICITRDGLHVTDQPISPSLYDYIDQLKLKSADKNNLKLTGVKLYNLLLKPIEPFLEGKEELIIVPYNQLWNVNFDLLLTEKVVSDDFKKWPFLLKKYAISYANSATLLLAGKRKRERTSGQLLAYSYTNINAYQAGEGNKRGGKEANLPGTVDEIKSIEKIIAGDYYYDDNASEESFKKNASKYSILHLALHGDVNYQNPEQSRLFFGSSGSDSTEDGILYPFELYEMTLNANLAVLSACDTGSGEIVNGEGIISIGRAFKYAGVNSLILSRTEISDPITPIIMASFYKHLIDGKNKAQALRLAKLEFLQTTDNIFSNPFYWGNFFVLGNTAAVPFEKSKSAIYWTMAACAILLFLLFVKLRKGNRSGLTSKKS